MSAAMSKLRAGFGLMIVLLGSVIVGRGVLQGAPLSFTLMGALMVALGLYRLRLLLRESEGTRR